MEEYLIILGDHNTIYRYIEYFDLYIESINLLLYIIESYEITYIGIDWIKLSNDIKCLLILWW